jgi:hypothetical protein
MAPKADDSDVLMLRDLFGYKLSAEDCGKLLEVGRSLWGNATILGAMS